MGRNSFLPSLVFVTSQVKPHDVQTLLSISGRGESCIRPTLRGLPLGDHKDRPYKTVSIFWVRFRVSYDPARDLLNAIHPHYECWRVDLRHALATDLVGETRQCFERGLKCRRSAETSGKIAEEFTQFVKRRRQACEDRSQDRLLRR